MRFTSVVSVVAGGWSFNLVNHLRVPGHVIAVNDSAFFMQRPPHEIVSMDRLWSEYRWERLKQKKISTFLRKSAVQNLKIEDDDLNWLTVFDCDNETVDFIDGVHNKLNGTNSGVCALNRAYQLKPEELYLFGFDMQPGPKGQRHWYPDYPYGYTTSKGKFETWAREFKIIAGRFRMLGTKVWNVSENSQITSFKKMMPQDLPRFAA